MPDIDVDFEDEPAGRGHRLRHAASTARDHVAQIITFGTMLARAAIRDVGRVLGHSLRRGRPDRQGRPEPARDQARRGARDRADAARAGRRRPGRQADHRLRPPARGRRPQRVDPRRRRRHLARAADRAHAAPEGDELRRAHDPVRDARDRGAGPAEVRLPGPVEPDDPAPGGRPGPAGARGSRSTSTRSRSTTPTTFELLASGETTGIFQLESAGHAPLHPRAAPDVGLRPRGDGRALPARARWTTSRPTSGASTARRR